MKQAGCPYCHDGYIVRARGTIKGTIRPIIFICNKCKKEILMKTNGEDKQ